MTQIYGRTFWGEAFLESLKEWKHFANRLERGKTYANTGRVIQINIQKMQIKAKVAGK